MIDTLSLTDDTAGITLGTLNDMGGAAQLTLLAWIIATSFAAGDEGVIFGKSDGTGNVGPWKLQIEDGGVGLRFILNASVGGDVTITDATVFSTGTLYLVAGVYDGASMITYVNGVATTSAAQTGTVESTADPARIGGLDTGTGVFRRKFNGRIEDAQVYTRGLSANEMLTIYNARGHAAIKNGMLHRWILNEATPGTVAATAGQFKDEAAGLFNASPIFSPVYRAAQLSHRRRFL